MTKEELEYNRGYRYGYERGNLNGYKLRKSEEKPCEDAISREDVIKAIDRHTFNTDDGLCLDEDISIILEGFPPVKPARKKGKWLDRWDKIFLCENKNCSICGHTAQTTHNYCPNCGAEMESEEV